MNRRKTPKCVVLFVFALSVSAAVGQESIERYAEEGQAALAAGRYADAEKAFEKLRELEPGMAEVHANLGLIYFEERRYEEAIPALRQALKLKPTLSKSDNLLAMSLSEIGHYDQAVPGLDKCLRRSPDSEIRRMCGLELERAYTGLKRDSKAVEVAMELNRLYPEDPEILYQAGKVYGNFAFLTMEKLAQVAPSSVWRHLGAAEAHESQGSYSEAIQEYREVLRVEPGRPAIHYRIGRSLMGRFWQRQTQEDLPAAQKEFEEELRLHPDNANAAYELGEMRRKSKQNDEAERYFEQAIQHYPDFAEAQLGLAAVLLEKNQPDQALPHAERAVAVDPENEVCWYRLAKIQRSLGNLAEQEKALVQYRRLHDLANQQKEVAPVFSPREVTKQEVDPTPSQ
ncbi:MAG TPA: tetratricopeptide repeat protein [Candidatus Dormibacteraeota bacterium]|nr:tetratricopeptide repeat protein [Candidatus Dormibacteraeota bacterium]